MLGKGGNGTEVVSMTERDKLKRMAPLRRVEAYWQGLCAPDAVPLRSQIDPRGMEDALENAFLMERIAPTMAKIRVAGTHLNDLMGMQIAGMPLSSLITPADRDRFGQAVENLFGDPAVVRMDLEAEGGFGKPAMQAHVLLLPLRSDFGDLTRGLGALVSHGRIGRTPRRFVIRQMTITPALQEAPATAVPAPAIDAQPRQPLRGFSEDATPFVPRDAQAGMPDTAQRNHLRLIVDND